MSDAIPRLEFSELDPRIAEALGPRVKRLGYLGEFFKVMAHEPEGLLAFIELTENLKHALPDNLTEVVALSVAQAAENPYERHQHERLCEKLGFSREWIKAVLALDPKGAPLLTNVERAVQTLVLAAIDRHGHGAKAAMDALVAATAPRTAVAVLLLVGRYATHAMIVNTLGLAPPVPSIFAGGTS